jgi:general secretion pathway protein N
VSRPLKLIALAIAAFALSFVAFLPASLLGRALPPNVTTGVMSGTIWSGATDAINVNGQLIGALRWRVRPLQLFRGRLTLDAQLTRPDGGGKGRVSLGFGRRLDLENVDLQWPVETLPIRAATRGWKGHLSATIAHAGVQADQLRQLVGTFNAVNLRQSAQELPAGSYRITFPEAPANSEQIVGQLQDIDGGPFEVSGTVTIGPGRRILTSGLIKARPSAPQIFVEQLPWLGEPDAQGRRQFQREDSY